ncbi:MAG TPA: beta-ketoacyl-[acyl-carrier-protein] synthase family protein [Candidatus Aquilonibacter sp.]
MMHKRRVVLTGIGVVSPLAIGKTPFWNSLIDGNVAIDRVTRFDSSGYSSQIAAEIHGFDPSRYMERRRLQWTDLFSQLAVVAAGLALEDANLNVDGREGVGVYTGSALGGLAFAEDQVRKFNRDGLRVVHPLLTISVFGGAAASNIAIEFGIHGPTTANANSCAAGTMAIGQAFHAIRNGDIDVAVAGGVEAPLAPLSFGAFTVARAMSTRNGDPQRASRPFDRERDGFVMAEGSGFVVLEEYGAAVQRGARMYAEIRGYGTSNDGHHMAAPLPSGSEVASAIRRALDDARVSPHEIEAINAHGSSTQAGDRAELRAYQLVFDGRASNIPVSATKSQHGHALGATGAWEVAITALTLSEERMPGNVNFFQADDGCVISCSKGATQTQAKLALSNSSGFGGINAALVMQAVS